MFGTTNIVFIDIDGVLNHQFAKDREYSWSERFGIAQDLVDNLKHIVKSADNVKIVISSSWRTFQIQEDVHPSVNWRVILEHMLGGTNGLIYGDIGIDNEFRLAHGAKGRAEDIADWLTAHSELNVGRFVIIDDECSALREMFPNNVVDCEINTFNGLTFKKAKEAVWILSNFGRDKKMTDNTFFTSDTHFWHSNIIKYCNRPWNSGKDTDGSVMVNDSDVIAMNTDIVNRWNSVVGKDDIVWHLGDFCLGKDSKTHIPELVSKLNGKINLVLGNHDHHSVKFYYDAGFNRVYDMPVLINEFVVLSHAPMEFVKAPFFNIAGHVHDCDTYKTWGKNSCIVCVERHDYTPISWKEIRSKYDEENT